MCYKIDIQNKNAEKLKQLGHSSMSTTINNYANGSIGLLEWKMY